MEAAADQTPWPTPLATCCMYTGRKVIAPNIANPTTKPIADEITNTLLRNSRGGITGSRTRRSTRMNPTTKMMKPPIKAMA